MNKKYLKYLETYKKVWDDNKWNIVNKDDSRLGYKNVRGTTYLIFSETNNTFKDWLRDFKFWKKPYKDMEKLFFVHSGFLEDYKIMRKPLLEFMEKKYNKENKLVLIGYSQGGATAQLAYEDLEYHGYKVDECVVFASPRVYSIINRKTLKERMKNLVIITNENDPVPSVPYITFFYKHIVKPIVIGKRTFPKFLYKGKDHIIYRYLSNLSKDN